MQSIKTVFIAAIIIVASSAIPAMALDSNWTITGQLRPRFEYRNGYRQLLPPHENDQVAFVSQRSRIGMVYTGEKKLKVVLQVQDVRTWGDETHTSNDATADKFDLHQGYLDLMPHERWTLRIGRQEIAYDEERLIGTGNWNQPGRVHDAFLVMWRKGKAQAHAGWAHHETGELISGAPYPNNSNYQDLAFWRLSSACEKGSVNGLLIFDSYGPSSSPPNRWTGGLYSTLMWSGVSWRGEAYYQTGKHDGSEPILNRRDRYDIRSFMIGLSAERKFGRSGATIWYDYLSGDDDHEDARFESFNPLYGTFHKYYGFADYFISFPSDTRGLGLQDLALKCAFGGPSIAKTQVDLHYFWLAELSPEINVNNRHLGFEADVMLTIPILKTVSLSGGASLVLPTETMRTLKGQADQGHWFWTMLDFNVK